MWMMSCAFLSMSIKKQRLIMTKLQWFNGASSVLQLALCGGLVYWLATKKKNPVPFTLAIGEYDGKTCETLTNPDFDTVIWMLVAFTGITGIFHAIYATGAPFYRSAVGRGNNWMRWVEYSITATIMLVAISMISAVQELDALMLIAVCSVGTMLLGQCAESAMMTNNRSAAISATLVGWILLLGTFAVILRNFLKATNPEDPSTPKPPAFVTYIVYIMFALFSSFGFIQIFRTIVPKVERTVTYNRQTEVIYSIASMVAKTMLVAMVYGGIVGQTSN
jgi:hypothetical protein